jgi:hypothetical protein
MPTYIFRSNSTGEIFEKHMRMSERESFIAENDVTQIPSRPLIHSGRGMSKPDEGFRDLLKEIKKKHSGGLTRSSINTF